MNNYAPSPQDTTPAPPKSTMVYACKTPPVDQAATTHAVQSLLQNLPAMARLTSNSHVLIKPNLLAKHAPNKAVTTHPDVLRGVILALQSRGVTRITVADSPGGPYTPAIMQQTYKTCGITQVCIELGAQLYTACESQEVNTAPRPSRLVSRFTFIRPAIDCDFIINLPKLKTHVLTGMSGAVKNQFGLVPGLAKAEFHMRFPDREHFGNMLVDINETVKADVHLVDGLLAMQGDGPSGGSVYPAGLLLAGENAYTIDLAICRYIGMNPQRPPFLSAATADGLCPQTFDESLLMGSDEAKAVLPNFQLPRSFDGGLSFADKLPRPLQGVFTRLATPRPVVRTAACIGCGKCAEICPKNVITMTPQKAKTTAKAKIHRKGCINCFCCHEMCPVKAIMLKSNPLLHL